MSLLKYIERVRRMDLLISMMAKGSPKESAEKKDIKRSTLFESLQEIREIGVEINTERLVEYYFRSCLLSFSNLLDLIQRWTF